MTVSQYKSAANRACRSAGSTAPAFPGKKSGSGYETTASLVIPYLQKVLEINAQTLAKMKALNPPASRVAGHALLLEAQQQRIDDLNAALAAAQRHDGTHFTQAFQKDVKQDEPRYLRAAAKLGLTACVRGH